MNTQPTLFVSHGAPTFALEPGEIGRTLKHLGQQLLPLNAVVVISPHWMTDQVRVTASAKPPTIHDFRGFDPALYDIEYPAQGHPDLARQVVEQLKSSGWSSSLDDQRGLDHGAWVPLLHLLPDARVPVIQVSLPAALDASGAWQLGRALKSLTGQGVLIVGSGSLTHNLHEVFQGAEDSAYAVEFAHWIRDAVRAGDAQRLLSSLDIAPAAKRAHPTPEHYWPLLVAAGAGRLEPAAVLEGGMRYEVLAMDAFVFGRGVSGRVSDNSQADSSMKAATDRQPTMPSH